jgi:maltooligosyltrehalose trehalohydrolase
MYPGGERSDAEQVETFQATKSADGWWHAQVPYDPLETAYAFSVGESKPLPDPRSERQPWGVHGASLKVNHAAFAWTDAGFQQVPLSSALIYEAHVGTFSEAGTFDGAARHLDHLVELGVTHLELMPVAVFSGMRGWGYDGVDLFAPHEAYGGPEGLKKLVDACHARGVAVIMDVVYNHLGPEGGYLGQIGPYFTHDYQTPWGDAVNLDGPESHEVRRFFIDNALMWLRDYHIDALRIDAVHAFFDRSALHFLEQMAGEVDDLEAHLGRRLLLIAESDLNDPRVVTPREANGFGIDAQWSDDFHHALHTVVSGENKGYYADYGSVQQLAGALQDTFVYAGDFAPSRRRVHGRSAGHLGQERFLGYHQNHDQVGNRALGDRLNHHVATDLYKVSAAIVLLSPFVPMLFQGEEWATSAPFQYFTDHGDPGLGQAVSEGRRGEFGDFGWKPEDVPDPQAEETFLRSKLPWQEISANGGGEQHLEVLAWYRALIRVRRENPDLAAGRTRPVVWVDEDACVLSMKRGVVWMYANLGDASYTAPTTSEAAHALLLASKPEAAVTPTGVAVPARSVVVLRSETGES